jgi:hypothetical protein
MAQAAEHLHKALNSNPSTEKKISNSTLIYTESITCFLSFMEVGNKVTKLEGGTSREEEGKGGEEEVMEG